MTKPYYYCRVLAGEAGYNLCVNSDLTVSCNCQDWFGDGKIGDLSQEDLGDIFKGEKAQRFRKLLAEGIFPVCICPNCGELQKISKEEAEAKALITNRIQKSLMIENTSLCNLHCLYCEREKVAGQRAKRSLSLEDLARVANQIKKHGITVVHYFNLGEPFLSKNIRQELAILRQTNPKLIINTSTNGVLLDSDEKREAALLMNSIFFSLDGPSQEIAAKYQRGHDFDRAYQNLCDLVRFRNQRQLSIPSIEWKYVVFSWNDDPALIHQAIERARQAQVDRIFFTQGGALPEFVSKRYSSDPFYRSLGTESWKGRVVELRNSAVMYHA